MITFDDDNMDNYLNVTPLFDKYILPATFFISNKHIRVEIPF
ncbi:polysaccharide deacetylase family protein [Cognataquiflexum rubidum]